MQKWAPQPSDTIVNERDQSQRFWHGLSILLSRNNKSNRDKKKNYLCSSCSFALVFQHVCPTTSAPHAFCQWQQPWLLLITWLKCAFSFSFTQCAMALLLHKTTCVYFLIASTRFTSAELPLDRVIYSKVYVTIELPGSRICLCTYAASRLNVRYRSTYPQTNTFLDSFSFYSSIVFGPAKLFK